jgi:ubiquinone/menaquinone biosynthesis C-methylase UbiE
LETDDFAEVLMSQERRRTQNPERIIKGIGVTRGMSVADLGCGPGFFTIPLALAVGRRGVVYAVDSDRGMLSHLRDNLERFGSVPHGSVKIIEADVTRTRIPSGSVDVALFANILHDLAEPRAFLNEVRRIIKKDSVVVDIDWKKTAPGKGPPPALRLSPEESEEILRRAGFRLTRPIYAGRLHYGLLFKPVWH